MTKQITISDETTQSDTASGTGEFRFNSPSLFPNNQSDILGYLDICRIEATSRLEKTKRAALGQFLTPAAVARFMASMFSKNGSQDIHILDPGAGIGTLFSALIETICVKRSAPRSITITAYEIEPVFLAYLQDTMRICESICNRRGIKFEGVIRNEDFIESAVSMTRQDLFSGQSERYTHAILNPPYHKLGANSHTRKLLSSSDIETSNVYTAFLALTSMLLAYGGEMVSITPRSFCNGVYFKPFRKKLLENVHIERLHLFESRSEAFSDDDVLQENIITKTRKHDKRPDKVIISSSSGAEDDVNQVSVDASEVVSPDDEDLIIHVPVNMLENRIVSLAKRFTTSLESLGLQVSTGPVVDFRAKEYIVSSRNTDSVPLIYPYHFENGYVSWPSARNKKPDSILRSAQEKGILLKSQCYVLVKRFSSKEEKRRLVAAIYNPEQVTTDYVGFENHINYFHSSRNGLEINLARGLAAFLNSTMADSVFRQFSGHTQVNASDLRRMKYPTQSELVILGNRIGEIFSTQEELDQIVQEVLLEMGEEELQNGPVAAKEKIQEALAILKLIGLPRAQQNERSALTLLSLLDLKPSDNWKDAANPLRGITPMMDFFAEHYGKTYKPNTRETVRRQTVHQFLAAGIIVENPDEPDRPINSPKVVYQFEDGALELIRTYKTPEWKRSLQTYLTTTQTLKQRYAQERKMKLIPVKINGKHDIYLSPGGQNVLVKEIIEEFCPRFIPGGQLVYVGDTDEKFTLFDEALLHRLGVEIDMHGKMPDLVVYYEKRNWLVLIEAVTSHGPVNPKRKEELKELFGSSTAGLVYVTAFLTRKAMVQYLSEISWETEVWVAEAPSHLIHFNGERFLGPYPS